MGASGSREGCTVEGCTVEERAPSVSEYLALREAVGWHSLSPQAAQCGLSGSLYAVCLLQGKKVIGCGRIAGDGGLYFYVQDIIIQPDYQQQGLGTLVMGNLMDYLKRTATQGAFIGLMAAPGLEEFYARFGFTCYPNDSPGMLIWK